MYIVVFFMSTATLTRPTVSDTYFGGDVAIEPVLLQGVPQAFTGVKALSVYSGLGFIVYLDGKRVSAKDLKVMHSKPMDVYDVTGMRSALYTPTIPPEITVTEDTLPDSGVDGGVIEILPFNGAFEVSSPETDPLQTQLSRKESTGLLVYRDPELVMVDGRTYRDLDVVRVRGLRLGKVRLSI
jgi:hypothetical protein